MPQRMTMPTSAPKIPATPSGPGVGGTRWWVMMRPAASAVPIPTTDLFVLLESALKSGVRITNPESAKIGIETTRPVKAIAHSSLPLPRIFTNVYAILSAAPETSRMRPIMTPNPMMMPILLSVEPKPPVILLMTSAGIRPPIRPVAEEARIKARNVWIFVFNTRKTSKNTPTTSPSMICVLLLIVLCSPSVSSNSKSIVAVP